MGEGPLPRLSRSTGHASEFRFSCKSCESDDADHARNNQRQYKELGVFRESNRIELARSKENFEELKRRVATAKCWGEQGEVVTPDRAKKMMPSVDTKKLREPSGFRGLEYRLLFAPGP